MCPQFHHNSEALAIGLIPNIADSLDLLVPCKLRNLLYHIGFIQLIRDLSNNDLMTIIISTKGLDLGPSSHQDAAITCFIRLFDVGTLIPTHDDSARGEIRALYEAHHIADSGVREIN